MKRPAARSVATVSRFYAVERLSRLQDICGPNQHLLHLLESGVGSALGKAESQGGGIRLDGSEAGVDRAWRTLAAYEQGLDRGGDAGEELMRSALQVSQAGDGRGTARNAIAGLRKPVLPQTDGQAHYIDVLNAGAGLIFGIGPAGTGKTFLAVAAGVGELLTRRCERLIVTRPAVEAGEKLGFLPGTLEEKVDPYMLPIWDALRDLIGQDELEKRMGRGEIEVAPLAFMRGRTLKNAFVIVDEAQNATIGQMKMLLTRLGRNARMVVTGDPTQVDLPGHQPSGLAHALRILEGVEGIQQVRLTGKDVVRHELVSRIIDAYASRGET